MIWSCEVSIDDTAIKFDYEAFTRIETIESYEISLDDDAIEFNYKIL